MDAIRKRFEAGHKRILAWVTVEDMARIEKKIAELQKKHKDGKRFTKTDFLQMAIEGLLKKGA